MPGRLRGDLCVAQESQTEQSRVQLVGVAGFGPHLVAHLPNRLGVELAQVGRAGGIHPAPRQHGLGAALLERRVVEEGIGPRGEDFERERRGFGEVAGRHFDGAAFQAREQGFEAVDIHRFVQAIIDRLPHQRMVGNLAVADDVFAAG